VATYSDTVSLTAAKPAQSDAKTCPSRACEDGVALLGVMTPSGRLAYIHPSRKIDEDFIDKATRQGRPERRFRFSGPCVEAACPQWTGAGCRIAEVVAEKGTDCNFVASRMPACTIRPSCRWFFQIGPAACAACPTIVADMGGTQTHRSSVADNSEAIA
jgi:hypothetical protein